MHANLKAKYQTADWRKRPLSHEMLEYARADARALLSASRQAAIYNSVGF